MWDLEYLLLFGVPNNKWEILDGRVRWGTRGNSRGTLLFSDVRELEGDTALF
jgi:hypothetical protein